MAVIFTVFFFPAFFVFTLPLDVTVAYFMLLDLQRSFLLAPLPALTLAFNFSVFPAGTTLLSFNDDFFNFTFHDTDCKCFLFAASISCYCRDANPFACCFFVNLYDSVFVYSGKFRVACYPFYFAFWQVCCQFDFFTRRNFAGDCPDCDIINLWIICICVIV